MTLTEAGKAEILRAVQRDDSFKEQLGQYASELLRLCSGVPLWIKYKDSAVTVTKILYDLLTTMLNLQTLGEEFTGIVQVNDTGTALPKKYLQFLMIFFHNIGKEVFIDFLQQCEKKVKNLPENHPLQKIEKIQILKVLNAFKVLLPILNQGHKALFYLTGSYYDFAKRLCGIKYVLVRYWLKDRSSTSTFKHIGVVSFTCFLINLTLTILRLKNFEPEKENGLVSKEFSLPSKNSNKCSLCLNLRQNTSVTPCGHLFCWNCIISWLQEQAKCPLCRQHVHPSRVVFIRNPQGHM